MTKSQPHTVTLQDIATRCDLSTWTVSSALRGDVRVKPATAARVKQAADELGYDPFSNLEARSLALRHSGQRMINRMVALFYPTYFHKVTFYGRMLQGLLDVFAPADYATVTCYLPDMEKNFAIPSAPVFQRGLVDGLITFSGLGNFNPMLTKLRKISRFADRPIISLLRAIPGCSAVLTDNAHGAYLATQHLIEHGHRHILHIVFPIGPNGFVESGHRVEGISMALQEHDLDPGEHLHLLPFMTDPLLPAGEPCNIATIRALSYDPATESHPVIAYLRAHPEVTAIETRNDAEALYLWALLTKAGFSIPEDISLIGFDDTDTMHDVDGENMLTSVNLRLHDVGRAAAELMLKHVNTHDTVDEQIIIPTTLSLRKSTAPARKRA